VGVVVAAPPATVAAPRACWCCQASPTHVSPVGASVNDLS
jgi:hypothetical protein